jgi:acyl carrier protein
MLGPMEPDQEFEVSRETVLRVVASQAGLPPEDVPGDRSLPDLGVSSFGIMRLVLALEEQFDMEFSGEALRVFTTVPVSQLHELVQQARTSTAN